MKRHLVLLALLVGGFSVSAQQTVPPSGARKVEYFDKDDHLLATAQGAEYRLETEYGDSTAGIQREYAAAGHLVAVTHYCNLRWKTQHGPTEHYYPSGQLEEVLPFNRGKMEGEILRYHSNGKLQRREQFKNYASLGGECFDADGKPVAFFPHVLLPQYAGGLTGLAQEIGARTKYPIQAMRAGQEAKVMIDFIVDKKGKVQNAHVREAGYPLLDAEALRVVKSLRRWTAGQHEGAPADIAFTLPVTFKLQ
ncbi:TonB family protein [Hymenobacter sp. BT186]|uniref:TonB family protein n=1 Tax=Hymenobacter telluris TaxID=2816474 RepID=A0A939EVN3_9BACT|nr:energy transducer TonB [Hymenobacter telluris]MBO0358679.1 TonB family protein [Hymenobacter telluris]MBW3374705.1 TonB family protein [Hymenobacter norwichensis]